MAWQRLLVCGKTTPLMILPCVWAQGFGCTCIRIYVCARIAAIMCFRVQNLLKRTLLTPVGVRTRATPLADRSCSMCLLRLVMVVLLTACVTGLLQHVIAQTGEGKCSLELLWGSIIFPWPPLGAAQYSSDLIRDGGICFRADRFTLSTSTSCKRWLVALLMLFITWKNIKSGLKWFAILTCQSNFFRASLMVFRGVLDTQPLEQTS